MGKMKRLVLALSLLLCLVACAPASGPLPTDGLVPAPAITKTTIAEPTIAPALLPGMGFTISAIDGSTMVYVPAGDFMMGSTDSDAIAEADTKPQHTL